MPDRDDNYERYAISVAIFKILRETHSKEFDPVNATKTTLTLDRRMDRMFFLICDLFDISTYQALNTAVRTWLKDLLWNLGLSESGLEERYAQSIHDTNRKLDELRQQVVALSELVGEAVKEQTNKKETSTSSRNNTKGSGDQL